MGAGSRDVNAMRFHKLWRPVTPKLKSERVKLFMQFAKPRLPDSISQKKNQAFLLQLTRIGSIGIDNTIPQKSVGSLKALV